MNTKDNEFMQRFVLGLIEHGEVKTKEIIISQPSFLGAVRTFYGYATQKSLTDRVKYLVSEEMFEYYGTGFVLTDKAKSRFWSL